MSRINITVETESGGTQTFYRETATEDDLVDAVNFLEEVDADDAEPDTKNVDAAEGGKGGEGNT
jgi:hypothetical protein